MRNGIFFHITVVPVELNALYNNTVQHLGYPVFGGGPQRLDSLIAGVSQKPEKLIEVKRHQAASA